MKHLVTLLQEGIKTVKVIFQDGQQQQYTYKTNLDLMPDDLVVVKIRRSGSYRVAKVTQVDDTLDITSFTEDELMWIVQRLDITMYDQLVETDKEMQRTISKLEVARKRKELMATLESIVGADGVTALQGLGSKVAGLTLEHKPA